MQPLRDMTNLSDEARFLSSKIRLYTRILMLCWTILICCSLLWNFYAERKVLHKVALADAVALIERDALYRSWSASNGGVYVPATEQSPPNPYLSHLPDRDVRTTSGKLLTLINPAYMSRQVNELAKNSSAFVGLAHITSLNPLRPENAPDQWEEAALRSLEKGAKEVSAAVTLNGKPYVRFMTPFITETQCLKCHAVQGDTVGTLRGGMSVSIPLQPLLDASRGQILGSTALHAVMLLLGLGVTGLGGRQLSRSALAQKRVENELHLQTSQLEKEIAERQTAQELLQESEAHLRIVADYATNWEYWRLPDTTFLYMSPSVFIHTGYLIKDFNNDRELLYKIIHPDDRALFQDHTHIVDSYGNILPFEVRIVRKDGEVRWVSHVCQQVYTPEGEPWGWRASNLDITESKQMEHKLFAQTQELEAEVSDREAVQDELRQLNQSLEKRINSAVADLRRKDQILIQQGRLAAMGEMINNIAHQWRQPLNNVGLIIQSIKFSYDSGTITHKELEHDINEAMDALIHMSRTIDDFRNFFRQDKQKELFIVGKTVQRTIEFISTEMASRNIQIQFINDDTVKVLGYENEYAQVLLNILSNARETSIERSIAEPSIQIRITSENGLSVVYISDNCGGIEDDVMPRIFDPYFTTRSTDKGTGIGLYMSKVIIEQNMGGHLTASNSGDGVEFRIEV